MNRYNNSFLVICLSLASAVAALLFTKNTILGSSIQSAIPFGDMWLGLTILIVTSLIAARLVHISKQQTYYLSIITFGLIVIGVAIKLSLNQAFEIYYADYANSGPARRLLYTSITTWTISIISCVALIFLIRSGDRLKSFTAKYKLNFFTISLAVFAALALSYFNLLVEASPYAENTVNFGVVAMPIVNVFFGALPPLDVQSQYGLYAYFMVPILKVTGLNIFTISLIFSVLFFVCFIGIYFFTYSLTRSSIIAFAVMLASFYLNTSFGNIWPGELYFQYRPIRMLAPCLALFFFIIYSSNPNAIKRISILACLSALVLWNLDSGIPTLAAFVIANVFNQYFSNKDSLAYRIKSCVYLAIEGVLIAVAVFALFSVILFILKNEWVTPSLLLEAQQRWRGGSGYFTGWSQAIILPTLIYCIGVALAIARGVAGQWSKQEFGLMLVALLGLGVSTYGTLNPQAAAITTYLIPVILVQFATLISGNTSDSSPAIPGYKLSGLLICLLPVSFLATSYVLHIRDNYSYTGIPTAWEITHPSSTNNKALWTIPGATDSEVDYARVKDLTGSMPLISPWVQKANWIKSFPFLMAPTSDGRVFIASMHDHFLYAAIQQASPIRIVNFYHIPIYAKWPLLFSHVAAENFDYIVVDQEFFLRNGDAAGPKDFDSFIKLVEKNYEKVAEKNIGFNWNYPQWKPSTLSLWKARKS